MIADELSVHPSSVVLRGSTKIGFSLTPRADKIWAGIRADSDVDLAIVDPDHFHFLDSEVRRWQRDLQRRRYVQALRLRQSRALYCYGYMDLPDTTLVQKYQAAMDKASAANPPGCNRDVTAFFFRDWWSLQSRYEADLRQLLRGLQQGLLPAAGNRARTTE
jgi:hypothetical protein